MDHYPKSEHTPRNPDTTGIPVGLRREQRAFQHLREAQQDPFRLKQLRLILLGLILLMVVMVAFIVKALFFGDDEIRQAPAPALELTIPKPPSESALPNVPQELHKLIPEPPKETVKPVEVVPSPPAVKPVAKAPAKKRPPTQAETDALMQLLELEGERDDPIMKLVEEQEKSGNR